MQKLHSAEAVCQRGALAGMSGVAVGAVPAEASCPPGGRRPWRQLASKEEGLLKNDGVVWGGCADAQVLGREGIHFRSCLPLEGRYVRNSFSLGDFCFAVVQVEQTIFPVAHAQLVHI